MRALVAGWFSFEGMGATAGDFLVRDVVSEWLEGAGCPYDVALAKPFAGGVHWQAVDSAAYSHVFFVCGPFGNGWPITEFLARFEGRKLIGVNLSMLTVLETWNPFDLLLERDSSAASRPDLAFSSQRPLLPIAGTVLIHPQMEYGARSLDRAANDAIGRMVASHEIATVNIDTRLDVNGTGLRTAAEVESLIARMDLVLTTRLHGLVLALKNGVPAIAIDPVAGGAKISRQAIAIGWPFVFAADRLENAQLDEAFEYCLTQEARAKAVECLARARAGLHGLRERVLSEVTSIVDGEPGG